MSRFLIKNFPFFASISFLVLVFYPLFFINSSGHFEVFDCIDLQGIGSNAGDYVGWTLASDYMLMNDIDCSDTVNWNGGAGFDPIGGFNELVFTGSLEGQNFTISDLFIDCNLCDGLGLFAVTLGATLQNINFDGGSITATNTNSAGSLVGIADGGTTIYNISTNITINVDGGHIGGIAGSLDPGGLISNSYSTGNVITITGPAGGLVGGIYTSTIDNSCSSGNVLDGAYALDTAEGWSAENGGLVGYADNSIITKSYATGRVEGNFWIGGLVGHFEGVFGSIGDYYISESYASGPVVNTPDNWDEGYSGGLVGYLDRGTISNSYAIGGASSPNSYVLGGLVGHARNSTINNSYATGKINAYDSAGGFIGWGQNLSGAGVTINNSFSASEVSYQDSTEVGGLVGLLESVGVVVNSFYDFVRSGSVDDCVGSAALGSSVDCTQVNTVGSPNTNYFFGNSTNPPLNAWNFDTIWMTQNGTYPILRTFGTVGGSCGPQVLGVSDPSPSVTVSADPSSITEGGNSTISWTSTDTTSCSASWTGSTAISGSEEVSPAVTTEYTITCVNGVFSDEDSVTVMVSPAPPPVEESTVGSSSSRRRPIEVTAPPQNETIALAPTAPPSTTPPPPSIPPVTPTPPTAQETPIDTIDEEIIEEVVVENEQTPEVTEPLIFEKNPPTQNEIEREGAVLGIFQKISTYLKEMTLLASSVLITSAGLISIFQFATSGDPLTTLNLKRKIGALGALFASRKKRYPWGTVYDSVTKEPLDPALVSLVKENGEAVTSAVTDLDGRYGFLILPGTYKLIPSRTNYAFPSNKLLGKERDVIYDNLYFGGPITIEEGRPVIIRDIPMDPENFDWNQAEKEKKGLTKFYSKHDIFIQKFTIALITIGTIWSGWALIINTNAYNSFVFLAYLVLIALRSLAKPQKFGKIFDRNGEVLKYSVLRVFQASTGVEIRHAVTDHLGRYFCLVPDGNYFVKIEKRVGPESLEEVYSSDTMNIKGGMLEKTFMI